MSEINTPIADPAHKPDKPNRKRFRLNQLDGLLLLILAAAAIWFYQRAAIGVNYHWQWGRAFDLIFTSRSDGTLPYFFQGVLSTVRLSLWGMLMAIIVGTSLGLAQHSKIKIFKFPAIALVQIIRNIPPLVFVFIFYFFISNQLIPLLGLSTLLREQSGEINTIQMVLFGPSFLWENLLSGVFCIGLLSAAYIAEIVRAGLSSIDKGQWEASHALGLSRVNKYVFVIAPQVMAAITPALAGQAISLVKDSSIVSLISIQEMTFVGTEIANSSGLIFEIWLIVGAFYFVLCFGLSLLFRKIEQRSLRHLSR